MLNSNAFPTPEQDSGDKLEDLKNIVDKTSGSDELNLIGGTTEIVELMGLIKSIEIDESTEVNSQGIRSILGNEDDVWGDIDTSALDSIDPYGSTPENDLDESAPSSWQAPSTAKVVTGIYNSLKLMRGSLDDISEVEVSKSKLVEDDFYDDEYDDDYSDEARLEDEQSLSSLKEVVESDEFARFQYLQDAYLNFEVWVVEEMGKADVGLAEGYLENLMKSAMKENKIILYRVKKYDAENGNTRLLEDPYVREAAWKRALRIAGLKMAQEIYIDLEDRYSASKGLNPNENAILELGQSNFENLFQGFAIVYDEFSRQDDALEGKL